MSEVPHTASIRFRAHHTTQQPLLGCRLRNAWSHPAAAIAAEVITGINSSCLARIFQSEVELFL